MGRYIKRKGDKPDMYDVAGPTHKGENEAVKDLDKVNKQAMLGSVAGAATNAYSKYNNKMIKDLKIFSNEDFGEVRTVVKNGEVYFIAKDVCNVLGFSNSRDAVSKLDYDEKDEVGISDTMGRKQNYTVINESGLYVLIIKSRKPNAKKFKKWLTKEVLPSIRKTGGYQLPQTKIQAFELALETMKQLEEVKPKLETYNQFIDAENLKSISVVAKELGTGQKRLFQILREKGFLMDNNIPYQRYIEQGIFVVREKPLTIGESNISYSQTYVTTKGMEYLLKKELVS